MTPKMTLPDAPLALSNGLEGPDMPWMKALLGRAGLEQDPGSPALLETLAACVELPGSVAGRIARLTPEPLDRLVLAALYMEGLHLDLRRQLREGNATVRAWDDDGLEGPFIILSAEKLVHWLAGPDQVLRRRLAERLLPQSGLAAKRLIERHGASSPLDGGVRLTPFLASLLYPGDAQGDRILDAGIRLVQPTERLKDVVQTSLQKSYLDGFLALCRADSGPGRAILLWGRSGTGKTLTAKALAGELGMPLLLVRTQKVDMEASLIEKAAAAAQIEGAAIFFDECGRWMDKESQQHGPSPEAAMLLQMLQDHTGVVIAAMNQPWLRLSPAFQRRFPTQVCFGVTDSIQRAEIWRRHLRRPIAPGDLERAAAMYDLSGGFIRNATARLNIQPDGLPVTWDELQSAVNTQLHSSVEWNSIDVTSREGRTFLDRDSRKTLQGLAKLWKRNALLSYEDSRGVSRGFKALFTGQHLNEFSAVAYLAHCLRRKVQTVDLAKLIPKDDEKFKMEPADLRRSVEACSLTNGLPVLFLRRPDSSQSTKAWLLAEAFAEAGGVGVMLLTDNNLVLPERFQPNNLGPWIRLGSKPRKKLLPFIAGQYFYQLQVKDTQVESELLEMRNDKLYVIARWALAHQRLHEAEAPPGVIQEEYLKIALAQLAKPSIQSPLF